MIELKAKSRIAKVRKYCDQSPTWLTSDCCVSTTPSIPSAPG
jgi:hypothetical protein